MNTWGRVIRSLMLACTLLCSLVGCTQGHTSPSYVETEYGNIPNVVGMEIQDAWKTLVDAGYYPCIVESSDAKAKTGTVAKMSKVDSADGSYLDIMDPSGAIHPSYNNVTWNAEVTLEAAGLAQIPLQLTSNHTAQQAQDELRQAGFTNVVTSADEQFDPDANRVIRVEPPLGSWVSPDTTVTLTVSDEVAMPNVLGMNPVEASGTITMTGLTPSPNITSWQRSDERGWDMPTVIGTSIEPGEKVPVGTVIEIEYSGPVEGTAHTQ